jgi:hypothetical protein
MSQLLLRKKSWGQISVFVLLPLLLSLAPGYTVWLYEGRNELPALLAEIPLCSVPLRHLNWGCRGIARPTPAITFLHCLKH